jgi:TRAP-type uncharacterized transport system fused permease subunit
LGITLLAAALSKYLHVELQRWEQMLFVVGALLMVAPGLVVTLVGVVVAAPALWNQWRQRAVLVA